MSTVVVGVDMSTQPKKVGLALGELAGDRIRILEAGRRGTWPEIDATVAGWLSGADRALLAVDAPLGWPEALGRALAGHRAGRRLDPEPDFLFRRETDRFVRSKWKKQPLDVGADRIARTARAALGLLDRLESLLGRELPLAWSPEIKGPAVVEVYPAGTLVARRIGEKGYKQPERRDRRSEILDMVPLEFAGGEAQEAAVANDDAFDACLCVLAGADFLRGECWPPEDPGLARKEGWIWIRKVGSDAGGER